MTVHKFPDRITKAAPRDQLSEVCTATGNQMLAAIVTKYPEIRLTSDEILGAAGLQPVVTWIQGAGEWSIETKRKVSGE
jgi:hypothetical protein